MASKYWLKIYYEMLDDPKVGILRPALRWRFIETLLVAGEYDKDGLLPKSKEYAWRVRESFETVETDFVELAEVGLLTQDGGNWIVKNFSKRQAPLSGAERTERYRKQQNKQEYYGEVTDEKQSGDNDETKRHTDTDIDTDIDKKREKNTPEIQKHYEEILDVWGICFPDKAQPRRNNKTLRGKLAIRRKDEYFRENWEAALRKAGESAYLHSNEAPWFDLGWFLKNDDYWERCLNGKYGGADKSSAPSEPKGFAAARKILQEIENGNA